MMRGILRTFGNSRAGTLDHVLGWVAITVIVAASLDLAMRYLQDTRPPVTMIRTETLNSPIRAGENLVVRIVRDKVRDCPLVSYRNAINQDGVVFPFPTQAVPAGGPVDVGFIDFAYPTPVDLPPGDYDLHVSLVYECTDGNHYVEQPPARFRVVE